MKSLKPYSRIITAASFIITILAFISVEAWETVLPSNMVVYAPTIVAVIGYLATQLSEEQRVVRAEEMKVAELKDDEGC